MATIRDVARRASVSIATVSHVLNETRPVRPETQERVREAVKALGYRPLAIARQLRRGKSDAIGVLVSDVTNPFFPQFLQRFEDASHDAGLEVILGNTSYERERCRRQMERMLASAVRGVLVFSAEIGDEELDPLIRAEVPLVIIDGEVPGASRIAIDYDGGMQQGVQHLIDRGHRRFGFVGGAPELATAKRREVAFRAAVASHGGASFELFGGDFQIPGGRAAARAWLASEDRPTAVICANDLMAMAFISEVARAGVRVPEELSVLGQDGIAIGALSTPPLTTLAMDLEELATKALQALENLAGGGSPESECIAQRLSLRGSTAPLPSAGTARSNP